jgi:hypothetical protein
MTFEMNQVVWWEPYYFKWDEPALVEVVEVYRCGSVRLSNGQTTDKDGNVIWLYTSRLGQFVGKIHLSLLDEKTQKT